jgi:predicted secreted protein
MNVVSGIVLFSVIWFVALLVALPIGLTTQGEAGEVVPGTPSSAPVDAMIRRKLVLVTLASAVIWAAIAAFIIWGGVSIEDIDVFGRMRATGL